MIFSPLCREVQLRNHRFGLTFWHGFAATKSGKLSGIVTVEHWGKPRDLFIPTVFEFDINFFVPKDFGVPGAIIVNNGFKNLVLVLSKITITTEFLLREAQVTMPDNSIITFACNSWVYASEINKQGRNGRVFFVNKVITCRP